MWRLPLISLCGTSVFWGKFCPCSPPDNNLATYGNWREAEWWQLGWRESDVTQSCQSSLWRNLLVVQNKLEQRTGVYTKQAFWVVIVRIAQVPLIMLMMSSFHSSVPVSHDSDPAGTIVESCNWNTWMDCRHDYEFYWSHLRFPAATWPNVKCCVKGRAVFQQNSADDFPFTKKTSFIFKENHQNKITLTSERQTLKVKKKKKKKTGGKDLSRYV